MNATWVQLVFQLVRSPGNWLYCSIFLTKLSCSSLRGQNYTSIYLYQSNVEVSEKRYQVNMVGSVFPNPALICINYIFLFNSVLRLSAVPAYCLGSATDGQTHHFCRSLCLSLKKLAQEELFSIPLDFHQVQGSRDAQYLQSHKLLRQIRVLGYKLFGLTLLKTSNFCGCCLISSVSLGAEGISSPPYDGKTSGSL